MEATVTLSGFKELAEGLRELPGTVSRRILGAAVSAGALTIQLEMKKNAEAMRDTGTLARSIYRKYIAEASGPEKKVYIVAPRRGKKGAKGKKKLSARLDAYYAGYVELGHFSRPAGTHLNKFGLKRANVLPRHTDRGGINNEVLADQVQAGNVKWVPAHPFMRPAFDVKKEAAVEAIGQVLGAGIAAAARAGLRK